MEEEIYIREKATGYLVWVVGPGVLSLMGLQMIISGDSTGIGLITMLAFAAITFLVYRMFKGIEIVVTNKRVYGKGKFGMTIDLPLDSISAVATTSFTHGVSVSTSSGRMTFYYLINKEEIASKIRNLLIERQDNAKATATVTQQIPLSNADELKKYKELLDSGVISQEEFDAKKKQLLGL